MTEEEREKLINDMEIAILKEGVGTILHSSQLSRMARAALAVAEEAISKDYRARIAELEAALNLADKLAISVLGSWDAFEPALRSDIGNTNYRCVAEKVAEYRAARAAIREGENRDD